MMRHRVISASVGLACVWLWLLWSILVLIAGTVRAEEPQAWNEPPPFFEHPSNAGRMGDPYAGVARRPDGADCCGGRHCFPVPMDRMGRIQLEKDGPWVDPRSITTANLYPSTMLATEYAGMAHVCEDINIANNKNPVCIFRPEPGS